VSVGQVLIEIDNRDANAQLQKAEAGLRQAQEGLAEVEQATNAAKSAQAAAEANRRLADSTYARYQSLFERKSVSPQEFDEAKAKQEMAQAEARRAGDTLKMLAAKRQQALAGIDQAKAEVTNAQVCLCQLCAHHFSDQRRGGGEAYRGRFDGGAGRAVADD
jgi:multidrug resistance efflux pump